MPGICIGKLALYCAVGGVAPHRVLPVMVDVGTNNSELLADQFYLGTRRKRLSGREYYLMLDEAIQVCRLTGCLRFLRMPATLHPPNRPLASLPHLITAGNLHPMAQCTDPV